MFRWVSDGWFVRRRYLNGNSYEGVWELDHIKGQGRYTLLAGSEKDEETEKVHLRVFGY